MNDPERVLAFVIDHPGCTARAITDSLYGVQKARASERTKVYTILRDLDRAGAITIMKRRDCDAQTNGYWPRGAEPLDDLPSADVVADDYAKPRAVLLTGRQRFLIRHVLRTFTQQGRLGQPSLELLAHLEAEEQRLDLEGT